MKSSDLWQVKAKSIAEFNPEMDKNPGDKAKKARGDQMGTDSSSGVPVQYQLNSAVNGWDRMAQWESDSNWRRNEDSGYHGGMQFSHSSWRPSSRPPIDSAAKDEQMTAAERLLAVQGPGQWGSSLGRHSGTPGASGKLPHKAPKPIKKSSAAELHTKTTSLLEDYFSVELPDNALQCVEELKAPPAFHPELVKQAIVIAPEKTPPCVEQVIKLLEFLFTKNLMTAQDIATGCLLYGSTIEEAGIDLPVAANNFGEVIGKLLLAGSLDFKIMKEILMNVRDKSLQKAVFAPAMNCIQSSPFGKQVLVEQEAEIEVCESLIS